MGRGGAWFLAAAALLPLSVLLPVLILLPVQVLAPASALAADPSALWKIVSEKCVPHEENEHEPSPCSVVDLSHGVQKGFAVLKDINGAAQFLLIPTARVGGIDDPVILEPDATNYFSAAWNARAFVEGRLHITLPRDGFALAINSIMGRTQNQLHIHMDCIRPDVRATLKADLAQITDSWEPLPTPLAGDPYRAIRITQETLDGVDPFRLLADSGKAHNDMGLHTLVLVGETFPDGIQGFVLLDGHADLARGDRGSGELLEDHSCAVARN